MSFRLAAYAVCIQDGRVLLARHVSPVHRSTWTLPGGRVEHNVGIFYRVRITGGQLRPEPDGEIAESAWTPFPDVAQLCRSSLVDIGLALAQAIPATGHVGPVPVGGLIQH
jgi:8-oxo-dGTP diphosphatase